MHAVESCVEITMPKHQTVLFFANRVNGGEMNWLWVFVCVFGSDGNQGPKHEKHEMNSFVCEV